VPAPTSEAAEVVSADTSCDAEEETSDVTAVVETGEPLVEPDEPPTLVALVAVAKLETVAVAVVAADVAVAVAVAVAVVSVAIVERDAVVTMRLHCTHVQLVLVVVQSKQFESKAR